MSVAGIWGRGGFLGPDAAGLGSVSEVAPDSGIVCSM